MIVVIDNYDSFVFNLARYFRCLGCETLVVRNDEMDVDSLLALEPEAFVISPGPCGPYEAGVSIELVKKAAGRFPVLGICLGMQAIVSAFGGEVVRANVPVHGQSSMVRHNQHPLFDEIPNPFEAGRYHSLVAEPTCVPDELSIIAQSELSDSSASIVMAVAHQRLPIAGLQFHPESIMTPQGSRLLRNFLSWAGCDVSAEAVCESEASVVAESAKPLVEADAS